MEKGRTSSRLGFTLIELLVVITIIAILASLAYPIFSSVQERAHVTQDLNNLRQIGIGTQVYLNDHDSIYFATDQAASPWQLALHPKSLPTWKIFQSPFDHRTPQENDTSAPVSYGLNENAAGLSADKVVRPTAFILLAPAQDGGDQVKFSGTAAGKVTVLRDSKSPDGGTQSKRQRINALYADLHADSLTWATFKQVPTGDPSDDSHFRWDPTPTP